MNPTRSRLARRHPVLAHAPVFGLVTTLLTVGCENLPGSDETQGAVAGGAGGAAVGAAVSGDNRLLGALIGGAIGAGGGYLVGANKDKILGSDDDETQAQARQAVQRAQANPATAEQARAADTADLNGDGFVTMDELVAMAEAGFSDDQILNRLRATDQVFELTPAQENRLIAEGVSRDVVAELEDINRDARRELEQQTSVIGRQSR
jgi:hypothetical protein